MEPSTKTCGPIPGGSILTHTHFPNGMRAEKRLALGFGEQQPGSGRGSMSFSASK